MRGVLSIILVGILGLGLLFLGRRIIGGTNPQDEPEAPVTEPEPLQPRTLPSGLGEAASSVPSDPSVESLRVKILSWNREALAALGQDDFMRAIELFERCVAADPKDPILARNLALARLRQAGLMIDSADREERQAALALVVGVLDALEGEEREAVAARIERWRARADHESSFLSSGNERFELSYDGNQEGLRQAETDLLARLDRAYQEFGERLGSFPLEGNRLRVVLYTPKAFTRLTGLGHWAGGAFDGTIRVPIQAGGADSRLDGVLRHELSHAFVDRLGGGTAPAWLNEGLAQYLEEPQVNPLRIKAAKAQCRGADWPSLDSLKTNFSTLGDEEAIRRAYGITLGFTAYLADNFGEALVLDLMRSGAKGATPGFVFRQQVGIDLSVVWEDMHQDWSQE